MPVVILYAPCSDSQSVGERREAAKERAKVQGRAGFDGAQGEGQTLRSSVTRIALSTLQLLEPDQTYFSHISHSQMPPAHSLPPPPLPPPMPPSGAPASLPLPLAISTQAGRKGLTSERAAAGSAPSVQGKARRQVEVLVLSDSD